MFSELNLTPQNILLFAAMAVSILCTLFALFAAAFAQSYSANARRSLERAQAGKLFSSLDRASHVLVEHPALLSAVHGYPAEALREYGEDEAAAIAYFFLLLNGYRQLYEERFHGNFKKMEKELRKHPGALNQLLSQEANQRRLRIVSSLYVNEADESFIIALENLAEHELNRKR